MLEVLGDILDSWGDECVEGLAKMRPEDIFRKARDVMTELAQLTRTQGVLIESLKGDIEGVRQELDNETKHSLTTQLLQCQARIDEDNRIAKTILSRLVEKDSKIFALQGKLKKYTHTTQQMKEIEQESDFHFTLLCEAHRKIQEIIPVHDEILARARATVKATSDCLDDALAAEEAFQADAKVNVEDVIPSVRVKRQTVKP
ncbi:conserved hypothetical protein [Neospora caninum Liverpool]|uniref:Uncharacterized protein n=1 Tax=Neospora caninum (strain Liverpool) TaxID=572307 RepID=F0VDR5_NEOCL|nr:conserved hypothetical protein [Neospora caninum Liverpool]CBZ51858.1 conserved hypothetical protein [Neospora caninum Liverpool]CEL65815.1 TPA: hypothetical protein BN1204_016500 [Neospora caninum Liverpool]|eukprot:XP_003881891.1 conserved hypothetical protein [Neospora caninum Liverpool]